MRVRCPEGHPHLDGPLPPRALDFAAAHSIALVQVVEGRSTFLRRASNMPDVTREEARRLGTPDFVVVALSKSDTPGSISISVMQMDDESSSAQLLGLEDPSSS